MNGPGLSGVGLSAGLAGVGLSGVGLSGVGLSAGLAWVLVGLGLAVVMVQRRTLAVGLITGQALMLVGLAIGHARRPEEFVAAGALALRAVGLATVFLLLIARTRDPRPISAGIAPLRRGGLAVAFALALTWLVPTIGLASRDAERAVLGLAAFGLLTAATRPATLFQVLGVVLVENGLALAALELPGTSWLIELGVAFDLILIALVAGVFHERIFAEFGAGDTAALRSLRDGP
jgi:hydrogenase-4 membrane subunit HyfE